MVNLQALKNPVIFFDGVCNLCTGSVQFVIKHDPQHYFRFASLQSELGQQFLQQNGLSADTFDSFIVWEEGKYYTESTAALRVAKKLNGAWPGLYVFILLPAFIRNSVYRLIARNRYRWFGKKETCWVPTPELNSLFISR
jgi:predicted DCC family thiol-disulfide oxidoreductase YuxK